MERFIGLVDAGIGTKIWDALGRRGQDGHRALQVLSRTVDATTHLRLQIAYDQGDAFVVERYMALLEEIPKTYQGTLHDRWTATMNAWAEDASRAVHKTFMRLARRWSYLLSDCRAWQFMPHGLYHLWKAPDAIDLTELMRLRLAIFIWNWKSSEDRSMKPYFTMADSRIHRIAGLYARLALGGDPATRWRHRPDNTIIVREDSEHLDAPWEIPWEIPRGPEEDRLDSLTRVAMGITNEGYGYGYEVWYNLTGNGEVFDDWGVDSDLRDLEDLLRKRLAKITHFARPPVMCPLLAEAVVTREMTDPHNDPEGCWTESIAGYLVARANDALRRPRGWYTERDLRQHVERCHTPAEWRPALYDLWKRLDGVVRTDVPIAQRRKAVRRAETLFHAETEAIAAKVQ